MFKSIKGMEKYFKVDVDGNVLYLRSGKIINKLNGNIFINMNDKKNFAIRTRKAIRILFDTFPEGFEQVKGFPNYGISKNGEVWSKKTNKNCF